jgi:hypothetical protein
MPNPDNYTLRFPIQLASALDISDFPDGIERELGNLKFSVKQQNQYHVIKVEGFTSEEAAKEYINILWAGLMWVLLNIHISFRAERKFDEVIYNDDPIQTAMNFSKVFGSKFERVDGVIDGGFPYVYPSSQKISVFTVNPATAIVTTPFELFFNIFLEGITPPASSNISQEANLRLALELYAAHFYEQSQNARFLTLVMALEVLTTKSRKHTVALELIKEWHADLLKQREQFDVKSDEYEALEALEREIIFRQDASLRSQIRTLVRTTLDKAHYPDSLVWAKRAAEIYDSRSTLVHEGRLETSKLEKVLENAEKLVEMVLKIKFMQVANGSHENT